MNASKVLFQMVDLIKNGQVPESVAEQVLERSGVEIIAGAKTGTYSDGMLCIGGGLHGFDPNLVTGFSFPPLSEDTPEASVPEPSSEASGSEETASGREVRADAVTEIKFDQNAG